MYKLHGLKFFSKPESRLRYYQVRMCKEDIEKKTKNSWLIMGTINLR